MAERAKDPVLNIAPVDTFDPKPTVIELRFDEPKEHEGKFGPQFIYGVKVNGKDHVLFASPALDEKIAETGARKGDFVAIVRTGQGQDTRWNARLVDSSGRPIEGGAPRARQASQDGRQGASGGSGGSQAQAPRQAPPAASYEDRLAAFLMDELAYWGAMKRATDHLNASKTTWTVDANACAFVLYKMAKDHGIELGPDGDPVEPAAPALPEDKANQRNAVLDALAALPDASGNAVPRDAQLEADALAILRRETGVATLAWADVTREQALLVHRFLKAQTRYEDALNPPSEEDLPF